MKAMKSILLAGLILPGLQAAAQVVDGAWGYYNEALLFSQTSPTFGGTARIQGLGGAHVSLGGDLTTAGINPAGLGFFNRSTISFTPGVNLNTSNSTFSGQQQSSFRNNFNFANLGVAFHTGKGVSDKFKGGSFAISVQRMNDFNSEATYQGRNNASSIVDAFIQQAGFTNPDNLEGYALAAYENYMIDPIYDDNDELLGYGSVIEGFPQQRENIRRTGGQYQFNFAWGGNYEDKVYFGGGLGIASLNFFQERIYTESDFRTGDDQYEYLNFIRLKDEMTISGAGVNATVGLIVRPLDFVTLGVSYVTPTYYAMDETTSFELVTQWNSLPLTDGTTVNERTFVSDISNSLYSLRTPAKLNAGASLFLGKMGFVSADIEVVDHASAQLRASDFSMQEDNQTILNLYQRVVNFRTGAELRMDIFRLRGGYAFFPEPLRDPEINGARQNITFGAGIRKKSYFLDMAVVSSQRGGRVYAPYFYDEFTPEVRIRNQSTSVVATVGFTF